MSNNRAITLEFTMIYKSKFMQNISELFAKQNISGGDFKLSIETLSTLFSAESVDSLGDQEARVELLQYLTLLQGKESHHQADELIRFLKYSNANIDPNNIKKYFNENLINLLLNQLSYVFALNKLINERSLKSIEEIKSILPSILLNKDKSIIPDFNRKELSSLLEYIKSIDSNIDDELVENLRKRVNEFFTNLDSERRGKKFIFEYTIKKINDSSYQPRQIIKELELQFAGVFDEVIAANVKNKINPLFDAVYLFANSSELSVKDDYMILCTLILESLIKAKFSVFSLNGAITRDERLSYNKFTPATILSLLKAQCPQLYIKTKEFAMKNIEQVQSLEEIIEIPADIFENTEAREKVINKINDHINQLKIDEASKQAIREFIEKSNTEGLLYLIH